MLILLFVRWYLLNVRMTESGVRHQAARQRFQCIAIPEYAFAA
jgi:hypothetical protein